MFAEDRRPISSCRHHDRRRAGRIVETLFVILALMCLPVLLFGNWFVSTYGNGVGDASRGKIAANATETEQSNSVDSTADASGTSDSDGKSEGWAHDDLGAKPDESETEDLAQSDSSDQHDESHGDEDNLDEQDPSVAAAHKLVDTDEAAAEEDGSGSKMVSVEEHGGDLGGDLGSGHKTDASSSTDMDLAADITAEPTDSVMSDLLGDEPEDLAAPAVGTEPAKSDLASATVEPADNTMTDADGNPSATELDLNPMLDAEEDEQPADPFAEPPPVPQPRVWTKTNGQTATAIFVRVERVNDEPCAIIYAPSKPEKKLPMPLRLLSDADVEYVKNMHRKMQPSN